MHANTITYIGEKEDKTWTRNRFIFKLLIDSFFRIQQQQRLPGRGKVVKKKREEEGK